MKTGPWRLIFLGTPQFAVPTLKALLSAGEKILGVVTQPDRPRGRGQKVSPSPVKELALAHGLAVLQPRSLKDPEFLAALRAWTPELLVVVAYGRLLPPELLALPTVGPLNVHASLLPRHRGAAPINWALFAGDRETGVTVMWMVAELDAGPIFLQERVAINPDDHAGTLSTRLADSGAALLVAALDRLRRGEMTKIPQPTEGITFAPPLTPEMRLVDWRLPAPEAAGRIRGQDPRPGAYTRWRGERLLLFGAQVAEPEEEAGAPGTVLGLWDGRLHIACGRGSVSVGELQMAGKNRLPAADFLRGQPLVAQVLG